jgi:hypothetical protein
LAPVASGENIPVREERLPSALIFLPLAEIPAEVLDQVILQEMAAPAEAAERATRVAATATMVAAAVAAETTVMLAEMAEMAAAMAAVAAAAELTPEVLHRPLEVREVRTVEPAAPEEECPAQIKSPQQTEKMAPIPQTFPGSTATGKEPRGQLNPLVLELAAAVAAAMVETAETAAASAAAVAAAMAETAEMVA